MTELSHGFAAARRIFRRGVDRATFLATFFLPVAKRNAVHSMGAFIHLTMQAVAPAASQQGCGGGCGSNQGDEIVSLARGRIEAVFSGRLELPLPQFRDDAQWTLLAAAESARRFEIPIRPMLELVTGVVAAGSVKRYATWRSLRQQCAQTGGSTALLMAAILGATHSDVAHYATQVGQAAWLTKILRRLRQDLQDGRICLPLEDLVHTRCGEKDLLALRPTSETREIIRLEVARARELLEAGAEGICWLAGDGSRVAAASFVANQLTLLDAIERDPAAALRGEVRPSAARRVRRLPDAWRLARRRPDEPVPKLN